MCRSFSFQVRKFRKLLLTLFYISLLALPTSALPLDQPSTTIKEKNNTVTVQVTGCKPLSSEELKAMLGPAFDESTMIYDEASLKRSMELQNMQDDDDEEDTGDFEDELKDETEIDRIGDKDDSKRVRNKYYMRRKRAVMKDEDETRNSLSDSQFLYQNLLHDSLKVHSRRKRSYRRSYTPTPPWKCKLQKKIRPLANGYFPKRIFDGRCSQDKCFYGMYRCNPVKFAIKLLKKDPKDLCRPVPLIGKNTTYEESWVIKREHVTVACECEYAARSNKKRNKVRLKS